MTIDATRSAKLREAEVAEVQAVVRPTPGGWRTIYPLTLVVLDFASFLMSAGLAAQVQFHGDLSPTYRGGWYALTALAAPAVWVLLLAGLGCYRIGRIGLGADEYKGVFNAGLRLTALLCFAAFVVRVPISREYVGVALPTGTLLTLVLRYAARKTVHRLRRGGRCTHAVIAVGSPESTSALARQLHRDYTAGLSVVAALELAQERDIDQVFSLLRDYGADTVAVASTIEPELLRRLGWQLEGHGITLVVAPALTNIAGPRISIRPVSGLPLLEVQEPDLTGGRQRVKAVLDRLVAAGLLIPLAPVLVLVALLIKFTSPGPVLFTHRRLGRGGKPFTIYKYRTMHDGAHRQFQDLVKAQKANSGGMFVKATRDPRVTSVGRYLRRFSIDELPQLWNVLKGDMSLVGPRPLPVEVLQMGLDVRRRLLVRPGMTGLWQVSGRSDLPYDEAVRIDLYYVENWSLSFDLMILWKTIFVALRGSGAY
jgi:exopolysaccharide biosynthesis polyprenyl glycosylphosphotransferase